ncbi:MAG: hypothetical protein IT270_11215 [Saprospiraceae bacterium]|nr:hypothetical protein [Saprospiraceae bacterium]
MNKETKHKIIRIVEAEPFWVAALWDTGEVRINDFSKKLNDWLLDGSAAYQIFASEDTFMSVEVSAEGNLLWPETFVQHKVDGEMVQTPLEMEAQVLFPDSDFVEKS